MCIVSLGDLVRTGTQLQKEGGAYALAQIAFRDRHNYSKSARSCIKPLETLLHSGNAMQQRFAVGALGHIAAVGYNMRSCIEPFVAIASSGSSAHREEMRGNATLGLVHIAKANVNNATNGAMYKCIEPLAELVRSGTNGQRRWAADALEKIAANDEYSL